MSLRKMEKLAINPVHQISHRGRRVVSNQRYVVGGSDGWLNVKREPSGIVIALPEYLRVELLDPQPVDDAREYFVAKEGVERNKNFSVRSGNLGQGTPGAGYRSPAALEFSLSKEELTFANDQKVHAFTHDLNPIAVGVHPIQIPDFPHAGGSRYTSQTPYAKSWFYLGHGHAIAGNNDRYLHPGRASAGCITVEPSQWTILYQYLILCRSGNGTTVGSVSVVR